ncbi:beta-lactamase family protein [Sabulilitoribacter arenilitoris]|uniref:Beta-lactamase family protein n=1 Tax=Wocania arenilitoris TaxID=2044858 RepID=A0AAE3EQ04_9FLAO|nr:serine hydrolase domain-containing protein [Wocania arenilitoris]MCF7567945.1 beta-lactamase family protein [Wocania arenilitoris]
MKQLLFFSFLISSLCFSQQENFKQLDTLFDVLSSNNKMMGSFSILKDGDIIYNKSIGYQYIMKNTKKEATIDSKYRIGSITKMFTSVMIFQLMDEKKISLNDKLSSFYPKIPNASKISISNLLNHTSGLFNITGDPNIFSWLYQASSEIQMLSRIQTHKIDFEPGEKMEYSNTNYILLGYILEKIEKNTYKNILEQRIVNKLKLKNTYFGGVINIEDNECLSYFYEKGELKQAKEEHLSNPGGAGAIVSNPSDLVVFMDALFGGKLMSETSFKKMTVVRDEMGSGIETGERNGLTIWGHGGGIGGFKSLVSYVPEMKTALAITANAASYKLLPIIFSAINAVKGKTFKIPDFNINEIQLTEQEVKAYEGIYESKERPFDLTFVAHGKILKAGPNPNNLNNLTATKKDEFSLEAMSVIINFNLENNTLFFNDQTSEPVLFTKKQ